MPSEHSQCRYDALKTLEQISYKLQHLKDMIFDTCPVMRNISKEEIETLMDLTWETRRKVTSQEK